MVKRKAVTLLELVMVIVILGIIASIGADIISNLYTNYLQTRTVNRLQTQTEITLEQIAKRLQYRIKPTVIGRKSDNDFRPLFLADDTYRILEWIGYSNESLRASGKQPGWSGFIDISHPQTSSTSPNKLVTPGTDLAQADTIMLALTYGDVGFSSGNDPALIFNQPMDANDIWFFPPSDSNFSIRVDSTGDGNFTIIVPSGDLTTANLKDLPIYEHYFLAHTAYAIVPEGNLNSSPPDFNLTLYYNYQPWLGEEYDDGGPSSPLAENVSLFRFRQDGNIIRLKLCLHDDNRTGIGSHIITCKERIIY